MIYIEMPSEAKKYHWIFLEKDYPRRKSLKTKLELLKKYNDQNRCYCRFNKDGKLTNKCSCQFSSIIRLCIGNIYAFILNNFYDIAVGELHKLYNIQQLFIQKIDKQFKNKSNSFLSDEHKKAYLFLEDELKTKFISTYTSLYKDQEILDGSTPRKWGAYPYVEALECNVCPLCNAQFTIIVRADENSSTRGSTRADLDHFIPKMKWPIFACSLYNLVPSCKVCNSSFKRDQDTDYITHFSPFDVRIQDCFRFQRTFFKTEEKNIDYVGAILGETQDFELNIETNIDSTLADRNILEKKVENNKILFRLKDVYYHHKGHVQKMIVQARVYNEVYQAQLAKSFPMIFQSEEQMLRFTQIPKNEWKNTILGKVTSDIIKHEVSPSMRQDTREDTY